MSEEPYQPLYKWLRTKQDAQDVSTDSDWSGFDGDREIGRVRKELNGPMQGHWPWSGLGGAHAIGSCHTPDMNLKAKKLCAG